MNHWPFILLAYGVTALGSILCLGWAYLSMRRAEARVEELGRDQ
jgi:hypothetical protein